MILSLSLAIAFNIIAGFNDGGNLLAAASASRTIPPGIAFLLISLGALAGPLIVGTAVAATLGNGIVNYQHVGFLPLCAGLAGGCFGTLACYAARVPTTASLALVSATIGSLYTTGHLDAVKWPGVEKVVISLFGSIVIGFAAGAVVYTLAVAALARVDWRTGNRLMRLQYLSVALLAIGYGSNDAEKIMGLIVVATTMGLHNSAFTTPWWVIGVSIAAFVIGMAVGGVRVAKTVSGRLFHIRPLHSLSFQVASAATVLAASALGGPLSTTETTASGILGVGAVANPRAVHWQVARKLVAAWVLTVPVGLTAGAVATLLLRIFIHGARF